MCGLIIGEPMVRVENYRFLFETVSEATAFRRDQTAGTYCGRQVGNRGFSLHEDCSKHIDENNNDASRPYGIQYKETYPRRRCSCNHAIEFAPHHQNSWWVSIHTCRQIIWFEIHNTHCGFFRQKWHERMKMVARRTTKKNCFREAWVVGT